MFLKKQTDKYTKNCSAQIDKLRTALEQSDAVLIGAGAGLSASAGFDYAGSRFEQYFSDFARKYGFQDMYSGGFYPYATQEEYWAYWSRYITANRYQDPVKPVYQSLLGLVEGKDYFVLTTNVDHCFQKAGFDKKRLFYTQGDYGLFQCSGPCCQETFDNESAVAAMLEQQQDMRVPSALLPICPHCGRPMAMNLRADNKFVEDEGWHIAASRYAAFLRRYDKMSVLFLELGVGYNTPGIIKYPFQRMTAENPATIYACLNLGDSYVPDKIKRQSICIAADIHTVLLSL